MVRHNDVEAFHEVLRSSRRIMALCGAGLSASSGLPTFRGAGGYWRNHDATRLATPGAFKMDPGLVWLFYGYRRHLALKAEPNYGHRALAALGQKHGDFMCLTQNVDEHDNLEDPFCPALAPASEDPPPGETLALLDPYHRITRVTEEDLPKCPRCKIGLQRPAVVWFGEGLDGDMLKGVDNWLAEDQVDLMLVVGTSAAVYPAAGYIDKARRRGAKIVNINPEAATADQLHRLRPGDFAFADDAAECLPKLLEPIIGKLAPAAS